MSNNRLFLAAAGSGKTTLIVKESLAITDKRVLITTFTNENERSIKRKFIQLNKYIPPNVTILSWFSFLIKHGLKPYRYWDTPVTGLYLVSGMDNRRIPERNFYPYYFYEKSKIYSNKLSKLVCQCNQISNGHVIKRLEKLFPYIYIDEIQDMSGYDYDIIKLFINSDIDLTMVGDPRQCVYETHASPRYRQYNFGKIVNFINIECRNSSVTIDNKTLNKSHRNSEEICLLANKLFPEYEPCLSNQKIYHSHHGLYYIYESRLPAYMALFNPFQLRWDKRTQVYSQANVLNFGESKGTEFEHIIIYPPKKFFEWLNDASIDLPTITKSKLYVAITRAIYSIGFVVNNQSKCLSPHIPIWADEASHNE